MKRMALFLASLMLGGCVSTRSVPTPSGALDHFQGQSLTVVTYKKPDFSAQTYGRAMIGGLIGAGVMISEGDALIAQNNVPDPAVQVSETLASRLKARMASVNVNRLADQDTKGDTEEVLSADAGHAGLVLDVETINWMFLYYPLDWTHYRVMMTLRARLIDAESGKRLSQAPCTYLSDDKSPPDYDHLVAERAAVLKTMLAAGADVCVGKMTAGLLGGQM